MWGSQTVSCISSLGKLLLPLLYFLPLSTPFPLPIPPLDYLLNIGASMVKEFRAHHFAKGNVQTQQLPQSDLNTCNKCPSQPYLPLLCVKPHHAPVP